MYIRVHPRDNVAILVHPEGAAPGDALPDGLVARERIPQSHKIALQDLEPAPRSLRYGQIIGHANRAIAAGSWVREEMIDLPAAPPLDDAAAGDRRPAAAAAARRLHLRGLPQPRWLASGPRTFSASPPPCNASRRPWSTPCAASARRLLPRFPNVDDVVAITHTYGCGVAIDAPGAAVPIRTLRHISLHANFGGAPLVVSLGCEKLQPARLFRQPHASDARRRPT